MLEEVSLMAFWLISSFFIVIGLSMGLILWSRKGVRY